MIWSPWFIRAALLLFLLSIHHASRSLAVAIVAGAALAALVIYLIKGRYLPRVIMDVLDRLTNKDALERAFERRKLQLHVINAEDLARRVCARVVGQDAVIARLTAQLRRRYAANRRDKPIAVFCFAGPPGVGKTHLAKVLADELFADRNHLHFFDMSQFSQPHAAASLFGQARGYVGSQSYGALTAALRDVPNSVVLLDEFEKADPEVHKRFLTAWNDGFVTELSDGSRVSTAEAVFILTTNAAARRIGEIAAEHAGNPDELNDLVKSTLRDAQFAPEVLSRIDEVFAFRPLRGLDIARVVALEAENLVRQFGLEIAPGGVETEVLLEAIETLSDGMSGGVRDVGRAIERQLSDGLIEARSAGAKRVRLVAAGERIGVVAVDAAESRPTASASVG